MPKVKPLTSKQILGRFAHVIEGQSLESALPAVGALLTGITSTAAQHPITANYLLSLYKPLIAQLENVLAVDADKIKSVISEEVPSVT